MIVFTGALTPDGTVSLYSGSQQTFTCNVTVAAGWTICGLSGISVRGNSGQLAANSNPRITTNDTSAITPFSTITIIGFTAADNGGTIQCIELADNSVQGTATVSIGTFMFYSRAVLPRIIVVLTQGDHKQFSYYLLM